MRCSVMKLFSYELSGRAICAREGKPKIETSLREVDIFG